MGGALGSFQKSSFRGPTSKAAKSHVASSNATATDDTINGPAAAPRVSASGANQHTAPSGQAEAAPAEGSAVGSGGDLSAGFSPTDDNDPSQRADTCNAAGATTNAASGGVLPGEAETGLTTTTTSSSAQNRRPKGRFSTVARVVKSFPRNDGETRLAFATAEPPKELTPTQAAVLAADAKLDGLLNVGGILRAKSVSECPHGCPPGTLIWDGAAGVVGSGRTRRSCDRSEGDRFGLAGGVGGGGGMSSGGYDCAGGLGGDASEDVGSDVMEWASRFCEPETGFPAADSEEGIRLGRALARHVARDGDAGLIGTR